MSSAGSKIQDTEQQYQYSVPYVTPSGHELSFYDTPNNERLVIKHTSGSHIEFKADGSVFIKAVKDIHTNSSILSDQAGNSGGADNTTNKIGTDHSIEVKGRLKIKCSELDFEIGSTGRIYAGTDLFMTANNIQAKANEQTTIQGEKSIYMDTKEMRERVVGRTSEIGTVEDGSKGGANIIKVHGHALIQNEDEQGGITIASKGYLNLVAGKERVDLVGKFTDTPSSEAVGTFTTKVAAGGGSLDVSSMPGDVYFESEAGAYYEYATDAPGSSAMPSSGFHQEVTLGDRTRNVDVGNEHVTITGIQTVNAKLIFLN